MSINNLDYSEVIYKIVVLNYFIISKLCNISEL